MKRKKNIIHKINSSNIFSLNYKKTFKHILKRIYLKNKFYLKLFSYKNQNFFLNKLHKLIKFKNNFINNKIIFNAKSQFRIYNFNKKNKFILNTNDNFNINYFKLIKSIYIYKNNKFNLYDSTFLDLFTNNCVSINNINLVNSEYLNISYKLTLFYLHDNLNKSLIIYLFKKL